MKFVLASGQIRKSSHFDQFSHNLRAAGRDRVDRLSLAPGPSSWSRRERRPAPRFPCLHAAPRIFDRIPSSHTGPVANIDCHLPGPRTESRAEQSHCEGNDQCAITRAPARARHADGTETRQGSAAPLEHSRHSRISRSRFQPTRARSHVPLLTRHDCKCVAVEKSVL